MRRILFSIVVIGIAISMLGAGTLSYFSDTEISKKNTLAAGQMNLKIDCHSEWWRQLPTAGSNDWEPHLKGEIDFDETNLNNEKFFAWRDIKPGDWGEATISIHVINNDAWLWINADNIHNDDNNLNEPEKESGDTTGGPDEGEIAQKITTYLWIDEGEISGWQGLGSNGEPIDPTEGDNKYQDYEEIIFEGTMYDLFSPGYDGSDSRWPIHLIACETNYIGWYWEIPLTVGNIIQSDSLMFDIIFYAEQYANNPQP